MHISSVTVDASRFPEAQVYPFNLRIFRQTQRINFTSNVTLFAGENGSGKSTLLRALARRCGIHIWAEECWSRSHRNPHEETLFQYIDVAWTDGSRPGAFFSAETYEHMAKLIELWAADDPGLLAYFGGKSLIEQSHGESFMAFFKSRYTIEGLYFLDEPETALSPKRQLAFLIFSKTWPETAMRSSSSPPTPRSSSAVPARPFFHSTIRPLPASTTKLRNISPYTGISCWTGNAWDEKMRGRDTLVMHHCHRTRHSPV